MVNPTDKWIIVDVDGVVADARHRDHFLKESPINWEAYTMAAVNDPPIVSMCELVSALSHEYKVAFVTGRAEYGRELTRAWLARFVIPPWRFELWMRAVGDHRPAHVLKKEIIKSAFIDPAKSILCAFEDDGRIVSMYRELGILCLQPEDRRAGD